jgi:hypothetical protein
MTSLLKLFQDIQGPETGHVERRKDCQFVVLEVPDMVRMINNGHSERK